MSKYRGMVDVYTHCSSGRAETKRLCQFSQERREKKNVCG